MNMILKAVKGACQELGVGELADCGKTFVDSTVGAWWDAAKELVEYLAEDEE